MVEKPEIEKECATCAHAEEPLLKDPCYRCMKRMRHAGEVYSEWQPREDDE